MGKASQRLSFRPDWVRKDFRNKYPDDDSIRKPKKEHVAQQKKDDARPIKMIPVKGPGNQAHAYDQAYWPQDHQGTPAKPVDEEQPDQQNQHLGRANQNGEQIRYTGT